MGRNIKAYGDDMTFKSKMSDIHLVELADMFQTLKRFNMYLNPTECAFVINVGSFLNSLHTNGGYILIPRRSKP